MAGIAMRANLWLQRPPRVEWCLRVIVESEEGLITLRTWFHDYDADHKPPREVVLPIVQRMEKMGLAALMAERLDERNYQVEMYL